MDNIKSPIIFNKQSYVELSDEDLWNAYQFAQKMINGHNPNIIMNRNTLEIFIDDFRGKLGEIAFRKYVKNNMPNSKIESDIDFGAYNRGVWDDCDLIINNKRIDVKAIKGNSSFLLIEALRFNKDGSYRYSNNNGKQMDIDMYVLIRIAINPEFRNSNDMLYTNVSQLKYMRTISAQILGGISKQEFWNKKCFAKRGVPCNKNVLGAICDGIKINPSQSASEGKKTEYLQQDNYVLSTKELHKIENIL